MWEAPQGTRPLLVELAVQVQTYDIDFASHVNNQVYVRWLEDLRMELLRQHYPLKRFMDAGVAPILASTQIAYKKAITLFDTPVIARMWCIKLGRATLTVEAEICVGGTVCAHAVQRGMLVNLSTGRAGRMPKELIEAFQRVAGTV
ncbi:MAG: acyl-CoA thioesterase [Candidatus Hydrogenedentes bacterium]|nr:acyl-CoA thioesterase [Candidatus Hydrogenedentota bacterium]